MMDEKKLLVVKTEDRGNTGGELIVQMNPETFISKSVGKYILLRKNLDADSSLETQALVRFKNDIEPNTIGLDQKLRTALAVNPGEDYISVITTYAGNSMNWFRKLLRNFFRTQTNLVRVGLSSYSDMEINMCRIRKESMDSINVQEGDVIVIESASKRIKLPVFELTGFLQDELEAKENYMLERYPQFAEVLEFKSNSEYEKYLDLFPILIDLDVRDDMGVKPGSPLRIYRSIENEIYKRLHLVAIPLIFTLVGALVSFRELGTTFILAMIVFCFFIIVILNFITIRSIVKFSVSSHSKKKRK